MLGWLSEASIRASRSNRLRRSGSLATLAGSTLTATSRPRRVSWARYTSPMPPTPSWPMIRYGPMLLPGTNSTVWGGLYCHTVSARIRRFCFLTALVLMSSASTFAFGTRAGDAQDRALETAVGTALERYSTALESLNADAVKKIQ